MKNSSSSDTSCKCLTKFHDILRRFFYCVGYKVGKDPSYFIIIPIFLTLLGLTGLQRNVYVRDPEYLFSPNNGDGKVERGVIERYFKPKSNADFLPTRITRWDPFAKIFVSAKDKGTILRTEIFKGIMELDEAVKNLTTEVNGKFYNFGDLCARNKGKCFENVVLNLNDYIPEIENGSMFINYPIMINPLSVPHSFGGAVVNETEGVLLSAPTIQLFYFLKSITPEERERSFAWEASLLEFLSSVKFEHIRVTYFVSKSLELELDRNAMAISPYLVVSVAIMVIFSVVSVALGDWVRSKLHIGVFGVVSAMMATGCGFGLLMYIGVPFIGINMAVPFLMMGIGIDDMFVVLSAWHRTTILEEVPLRMAKSYSEAAVSITITSLTNMLSFFIGCSTPFPAVQIFCLYTGVATFFSYIWFITMFGGILALTGYNEQKQKHIITRKRVLSPSEAEDRGCYYRTWCAGGINMSDPHNPKDNKMHPVMIFFRDYLGEALNNSVVKGLVIVIFIVYLSGAVFGIINIKEGLERRKLTLDGSYLQKHFNEEDILFRKYPYTYQVVVHGNVTYSDPKQIRSLLMLHKELEDLPQIGSRLYTQSWIRGFSRFLYRRPHIRKNITDEKSFIEALKNNYLSPSATEYGDIAFNEDETKIIAARFIIQGFNMTDVDDDRKMLLLLRKIARNSPFNVTIYNPLFLFFDQYLMVQSTTIQTITLAAIVMMLVSFIFIPNLLCSLCVGFSIISIEIGVIGYMSLLKVNLDSVSMINLIMCIGFSVDFSAHISYAYLTANVSSANERVRECLYALGLPVLQGGLSTIVGVLILAGAPSYIFLTFFKMVFLVISFGLLHGLLLLPVMLSLLGPGSSFQKTTEMKEIEPENSTPTVAYRVQEIIPKHQNPFLESIKISKDNDSFDRDLGIGSSGSSSHGSIGDSNESNPPISDLESNLDAHSRKSYPEETLGNLNKGFVDEPEYETVKL